MRNQKGGVPAILIVVIVLIVIAVGGVSWFIVSQDSNEITNTEVTNKNTNSVVNVNTSANTNRLVDETKGWLTYINEDLGIKLQYPETGSVGVFEYDNTQNTNQTGDYPSIGRAVSINVAFSEDSNIYIIGSSSDFQQMYKESYNGGSDLSAECNSPGIRLNDTYCENKMIAGQNTYDVLYYWGPECSPSFVREVKLNSSNEDYPGIRISQSYSTDGEWDCASPQNEFNAVTNSELKRLIEKEQLTDIEEQKLKDFDKILNSFQFTELPSN